MKINDYVSDLTIREGGKEQVTVAQVAEILKKVNKDLHGIPYILIRLKRAGRAALVMAFLLASGTAWADLADMCIPEWKPTAVIQVRPVHGNGGYLYQRRAS